MIARIVFFEEASAEVEHERAWYAARSVAAEAGFLRDLDHAVRAIPRFARAAGEAPALRFDILY